MDPNSPRIAMRTEAQRAEAPAATAGRSAAFTLIELLVVIGLIAMVMALALPFLTGLRGSSATRAAVTALKSNLALARQWAITHRVQTYVVFPADSADTDYSAAPSQVDKAYRAYAVFTREPGDRYVALTDWHYLPEGTIFLRDLVPSGMRNIYADVPGGTRGDNRFMIGGFPVPGVTQEMCSVSFKANGQLNQTGGTRVGIYVCEGFVNVDAAAGQVQLYAPNTTGVYGVESFPLTGQFKINEY
jgi:prepilin-type N-terminal cleavage/methylation domain-containing protein